MTESSRVRDAQLIRLLREHGGAIRRLVAAYESNPTEREDLTQEITLALWRALASFRGDCSERTFVLRVARNRTLTHRFRTRRGAVAEPVDDVVVDPGPTPETRTERASEREYLLQSVQRLPETLRSVVVLKLEGLDDHEIAQVLGITANNVAVRLTRGRDALRTIMRPTPNVSPSV